MVIPLILLSGLRSASAPSCVARLSGRWGRRIQIARSESRLKAAEHPTPTAKSALLQTDTAESPSMYPRQCDEVQTPSYQSACRKASKPGVSHGPKCQLHQADSVSRSSKVCWSARQVMGRQRGRRYSRRLQQLEQEGRLRRFFGTLSLSTLLVERSESLLTCVVCTLVVAVGCFMEDVLLDASGAALVTCAILS
jgi:hypothetical protein